MKPTKAADQEKEIVMRPLLVFLNHGMPLDIQSKFIEATKVTSSIVSLVNRNEIVALAEAQKLFVNPSTMTEKQKTDKTLVGLPREANSKVVSAALDIYLKSKIDSKRKEKIALLKAQNDPKTKGKDKKIEEETKPIPLPFVPENFEFILLLEGFVTNHEEIITFEKSGLPVVYLCSVLTNTLLFEKHDSAPIDPSDEALGQTPELKCESKDFDSDINMVTVFKRAISVSGLKSEMKQGRYFDLKCTVNLNEDIVSQMNAFMSVMVERLDKEETKKSEFRSQLCQMQIIDVSALNQINRTQQNEIINDYNRRYRIRDCKNTNSQNQKISNLLLSLFESISQFHDKVSIDCPSDLCPSVDPDLKATDNYNNVFESFILKDNSHPIKYLPYHCMLTAQLSQDPILVADSVNMLEIEEHIKRLHTGASNSDLLDFQYYESLPSKVALNNFLSSFNFYTGSCVQDSRTANERVAVLYDCFNESKIASSSWTAVNEIIPNYQSSFDKETADALMPVYSLDYSTVGVIQKIKEKYRLGQHLNLIKHSILINEVHRDSYTFDGISSRMVFRDNIRSHFNVNYLTRDIPIEDKHRALIKSEADSKKKPKGKEVAVEEQLSDVKESTESTHWDIPDHSTLYHYTKNRETRIFWELEAYFRKADTDLQSFQSNPLFYNFTSRLFDEQTKIETGTSFTFTDRVNTVKVLPNGCVFVKEQGSDQSSIGSIVTLNGDLIKLKGERDSTNPVFKNIRSVVIYHPSGNLSVFENGKWTVTKRNGSIIEYSEGKRPRELPTISFLIRSWHPTQKYPKAYSREDGVTIIENTPNETFLVHQNQSHWIFDPLTKSTRIQSDGLPIIEISKKPKSIKMELKLNDHTSLYIVQEGDEHRCMYQNEQDDTFTWNNDGKVHLITQEILATLDSKQKLKERQKSIIEFIISEHGRLTEELRKFDFLSFRKKLNKKDMEKALAARSEIIIGYNQSIKNRIELKEESQDSDSNYLTMSLLNEFENNPDYGKLFTDIEHCMFDLRQKLFLVRDHLGDSLVFPNDSSPLNSSFDLERWLDKIQVSYVPFVTETEARPKSIVFDGELQYPSLKHFVSGFIKLILSVDIISSKFVIGNTLSRALLSRKDIDDLEKIQKTKPRQASFISIIESVNKEFSVECIVSEKNDPDIFRASTLIPISMSKRIDVINFNVPEIKISQPLNQFQVFMRYGDTWDKETLLASIQQMEKVNQRIHKNRKVVGSLQVIAEELQKQLQICNRYYSSLNSVLNQKDYTNVVNGVKELIKQHDHRVHQLAINELQSGLEKQEKSLETLKVENPKIMKSTVQSNKKSRIKLSIFNTRSSLRDMTSSLVDNYFDTLQGRSFAIQNKDLSKPFIYSQADQEILYGLLQKANEGPLSFKKPESAKITIAKAISILESENAKPVANSRSIAKKKKTEPENPNVYNPFIFSKISQESLDRQMMNQENIRKKKTMEFDVYGEPREKFEVVHSLYKQPLQNVKLRDSKKLDSMQSSAVTKEFTLSESDKLKLGSAPADIRYERTGSVHRKLIEGLDKGLKPVKKPVESSKIIIFPDLLDFGQILPGRIYKSRFTIINKDSNVMRINVKPPIGNSGISVMKEEGPFAPGLSKSVNVYLDTSSTRKGPFANEIRILTEFGVYLLKVVGSVEKPIKQIDEVKSDSTFVRLKENVKRVQPKVEDLTIGEKEMNKSQRDFHLKPSLHVNNKTGRLSISKQMIPPKQDQ